MEKFPRPRLLLWFRPAKLLIEQLFTTHFKRLYSYALTIVKEEMMAEEMVQNVFFKIWEKKGRVDIQTSVTAYLYRSVYHESLNWLKHKKGKSRLPVARGAVVEGPIE